MAKKKVWWGKNLVGRQACKLLITSCITNYNATVTVKVKTGSVNIQKHQEESQSSGIQAETGMLSRSWPSERRKKGVQAEET